MRPPILVAALLCAGFASAAEAGGSGVLGKWRFSEAASCGIDDVRAGNLLTVTAAEVRYRAVACVRPSPAEAGDAVMALCDLGGEEPLPITFEWRFAEGAPATLLIQGAELPVFRCPVAK